MNNMKEEKGNVLVYAILTIAAILSTTIVISNLVQSSLRQTRFVSNAQAAYYAAESGAEKIIYQIRKNDKIPTEGHCGLAIDCEWQLSPDAVTDLTMDLSANQSVQLDLFYPENSQAAPGVESIGFDWHGANTWLEVSFVDWDKGAFIAWSEWLPGAKLDELPVQKILYSGEQATSNLFSANKNYRVRVKALYGEAEDLVIKLYGLDNEQGGALSVPNILSFSVTGGNQESSQRLSAALPRYAPTLGLFDYVLFSEEVIKK